MRRGLAAVGVTVVLAGLTSACTTSTTPPPEASSTAAASSTTNSPATLPSSRSSASATTASGIPEEAKANTPAGAEAFAMYFGTVLDDAMNNLDAQRIRNLSLPSCKSCSGAIAAIDDYVAKKQRFQGEYAHFVSATFANESDGTTKVLARSESTGGKAIDANGSTVETFPPTKGNLSVQLKYDGQWRVAEVQGVA